jgi:hypothetical protein
MLQETHSMEEGNAGKLNTVFGTLLKKANYIAAAFEKQEAAEQAARDLNQAGFTDATLYSAEEVLENYDEPEERLMATVAATLSDESKATKQYVALAKQGYTMLLVEAIGDERITGAAKILRRHGGTAMRHYGEAAYRDL